MTLEDMLSVINESEPVAVQVVNPETGNYITLVGPVLNRELTTVLREYLNPAIFTRTVESVRAWVDDDSRWSVPELFIAIV